MLQAHEVRSDVQVAQALFVDSATVGRVRQRFVEEELEAFLTERPGQGKRPKLTGKKEAHLITTACSDPPPGHSRWTLRLLADQAPELRLVDSISRETVRQVLKKQTSSPGKRSSGASRR